MISTLRSNFPTEPARGHTMGTPEDSPRMGCTLKLQMESANLSSTTDESRVQLMSLEYDEYLLDFRGQRGDLVGKQVRS